MSSCGAPQPTSSSAESERLRTSTACRARSYRLRGSSGLPTNRRKRLSTGRPRWRRASSCGIGRNSPKSSPDGITCVGTGSEEHTSELQSQSNLACRLLLEKKKELFLRLNKQFPHKIGRNSCSTTREQANSEPQATGLCASAHTSRAVYLTLTA